jgi:ribonucleotide reductase alpha subunit
MENDSIEGIYNTLKDCANISKWAGGIGLHIHNVRASGSYIRGTGGTSNGIVPMLKVFNNTAKYVDQCVLPKTKVLLESGNWIDIDTVSPGMKIGNMRMTDPVGFSKENYYRTNDTRDETGNIINEIDGITLEEKSESDFNFDTVVNVISHDYKGIVYEFSFVDTLRPPLYLTPEHPVLYLEKSQNFGFQWKEAKDIDAGDVIMIEPNKLIEISNVSYDDYEGLVYDLEMKTYPNYFTDSGLVHNGGGKRNGSFAIYLEPWHADIEMFLQMRKNHGDEELKARDLFYALWIPDLFMERIKSGGN